MRKCPECGQPLKLHEKTMAQIHVERYKKYQELQKKNHKEKTQWHSK